MTYTFETVEIEHHLAYVFVGEKRYSDQSLLW